MSTDTLTISIYEIDKSLFEGEAETSIATSIIERANAGKTVAHHFKQQQLSPGFSPQHFTIQVYFSIRSSPPKWREFWESAIHESEDILKKDGKIPSYIAFIWNDERMYAATGGQGNFAIQPFTNPNFGIEIISHLITLTDDVVRSLEERGLAGSVLGSTKFFRRDSKLADEEEFGKFYKTVRAALNKDILKRTFNFSDEDIKRSAGCIAKSSFQISKAIDLHTLLTKVLPGVDRLIQQPLDYKLNSVTLLSKRNAKDKRKCEELLENLYSQLFERFQTRGQSRIDFDVCHKDFEKYLTASTTKVTFGRREYEFDGVLDDVDLLFEKMHADDDLIITNQQELTQLLEVAVVQSFSEDGDLVTWGKLIKHLHGDIPNEDKRYFYVDGDWYEIEGEFMEKLNKDVSRIATERDADSLMPERWSNLTAGKPEDSYNSKYFGKNNTLVMHKVLPEEIELCDILHWNEDDKTLALIHVKHGFNNMMRDLTYQAWISARRVFEDREKGNYKFLKEAYKKMAACTRSTDEYLQKVGSQTTSMSEKQFLDLFRNTNTRGIKVVIAIVDDGTTERILKTHVKDFGSSIAKFTLLELSRKVREFEFDFGVAQIKR